MKYVRFFLLSASIGVTSVFAGQKMNDLHPYPVPEEGMVRMVFRLPMLEKEADRKVEIIVGKTLQVDCNRTWYHGDLESQTAEGWGFPYWVLRKITGPASTMIACPPGEAGSEKFTQVRGDGFVLRYNSKLPVVIFVPEDFSVQYRIWAASEEIHEVARE
jgi:ecotin